MERTFNSLNLDPLIATQVIQLVGMKDYEITNPQRYNQLRDIVTYFQDKNARFEILKVLSKNRGMDKLDAVWTYVALQNEKRAKLQTLNPSNFEPDIEQQLKQGVLSRGDMKRVKADIDHKKREIQKQKQLDQAFENKKHRVVDKVFDETKLDSIRDTLYDIEDLNKQLDFYD